MALDDDDMGEFKRGLAMFKCNSKALIESLTKAAEKAEQPHNIFDLIVKSGTKDILKLFLFDSIIKIIGGEYLNLFSGIVLELFKNAFADADYETKSKMFRMRRLWKGVISSKILFRLDCEIKKVDANWPIEADTSKCSTEKKTENSHPLDNSHSATPNCSSETKTENGKAKLLSDNATSDTSVVSGIHKSATPSCSSETKTENGKAKLLSDNATSDTSVVSGIHKSATPSCSSETKTENGRAKLLSDNATSDTSVVSGIHKSATPSCSSETKTENGKAKLLSDNATSDTSVVSGIHKGVVTENSPEPKKPQRRYGKKVIKRIRTNKNSTLIHSSSSDEIVSIVIEDTVIVISTSEDEHDPPKNESKRKQKRKTPENAPKKQARSPKKQARSPKKLRAATRPRGLWIPCNQRYVMSDELFNYLYCDATNSMSQAQFKYRKSTLGKEISELFPGCVIYAEKLLEAKKMKHFRISAYCAHDNCRNYKLIAKFSDPKMFQISADKETVCHLKPLARQVRSCERDKEADKLSHELPNTYLAKVTNSTPDELVQAGSYGEIVSLDVAQKLRGVALSRQDSKVDDFDDLVALRTNDPNTNYISKILDRDNFGVYIHSLDQIKVLRKLHQKRQNDGVPITGRLDATGNIARQIKDKTPILYHALTVNVTVAYDESSTAIPITEQYNTLNTSKEIADWLFDLVASYNREYDDDPLMLDYMMSDFSFANFHAVLLVFNRMTLAKYLLKCYKWINEKLKNGEFNDDFVDYTKLKMCFTHLLHTFADMAKRVIGKKENNAQLPESRVILEILAAMIKSNSYQEILVLWNGLSTLLSNEYESEATRNAMESIVEIAVPLPEHVDVDSDTNVREEIDIDKLPENFPNLYMKNPFYHEFKAISDRNTEKFVEIGAKKNRYYHPVFLEKFLKRFVPLIPLWTCILNITVKEQEDSDLAILQVGNNQPLETFFGKFKMNLHQKAVEIGQAPVKISRAITLSREITNASIKRINLSIPKNRLNSQTNRNPSNKRSKRNELLRDSIVAAAGGSSTVQETGGRSIVEGSIATVRDSNVDHSIVPIDLPGTAARATVAPLQKTFDIDTTTKNTICDETGGSSTFQETGGRSIVEESIATVRDSNVDHSIVPIDLPGTAARATVAPLQKTFDIDTTTKNTICDETGGSSTVQETGGRSIVEESVSGEQAESIGSGMNLRPRKNHTNVALYDDDGTSFKTAREQFRKRPKKTPFSYFDKTYLKKEATKSPKVYCNVKEEQPSFIVCIFDQKKIDIGTFREKAPAVQLKMLKQSECMKNFCIYCGSEDEGLWGCCTMCNRWFHCHCARVDIKQVEDDENYKCFICKENAAT